MSRRQPTNYKIATAVNVVDGDVNNLNDQNLIVSETNEGFMTTDEEVQQHHHHHHLHHHHHHDEEYSNSVTNKTQQQADSNSFKDFQI